MNEKWLTKNVARGTIVEEAVPCSYGLPRCYEDVKCEKSLHAAGSVDGLLLTDTFERERHLQLDFRLYGNYVFHFFFHPL